MNLLDALLLDPHPLNVWLAIRTDGQKGTGTMADPYNCSTAALFDARMNELPEYTRVHLGPGEFSTNGYADGVTGGFEPKKGMKLIGSGMDVTKLKLVGASDTIPGKHFFAFGHKLTVGSNPVSLNPLDFLEVSDLTIHCNLAAQTGTTFACGGVRIMGNHARVRRVKVTNWGTKSASVRCYAIAAIMGDATAGQTGVQGCGIEECMVVSPASSPSSALLTALHAGPRDETGALAEAFGVNPFIRNCFVDCGWSVTGEFRGISMSWCRAGIVEGNHIHNTKWGGPCSDMATIREILVRQNFYKNVAKAVYLGLGTLYPATAANLSSLVRDSADNSIAVATTSGSHGLQGGDRVKIDASAGSPAQFKGTFVIKDVTAPDKFRYQMTSAPALDAADGKMQKVFGTGKVMIERNAVELATGSNGDMAFYVHDTGSGSSAPAPGYVHGDVILRDNIVRYVDSAFETGFTGRGVEVNGAKNLLVRNNVIECVPADSLRNQRCASVKYFNNKSPGGVLIRGLKFDTQQKYDELETEAEDALVLAFVRRR